MPCIMHTLQCVRIHQIRATACALGRRVVVVQSETPRIREFEPDSHPAPDTRPLYITYAQP